jgi:hypothetical protein
MPQGPKGEKRPADVIGNAVHRVTGERLIFHGDAMLISRDYKTMRIFLFAAWLRNNLCFSCC